MTPSVVFTPEAEEQIVELNRYIAAAGSLEVASRYTGVIMVHCEELSRLG
nr:type II toxin-antitoxin system RelE/ParE family toxin [Mycobacterium sp.]